MVKRVVILLIAPAAGIQDTNNTSKAELTAENLLEIRQERPPVSNALTVVIAYSNPKVGSYSCP